MKRAHLFLNWLHRCWLLWCIEADVAYLRACSVDGLIDSLSLRAFREQIAQLECKLLQLEADSRRLRTGLRLEVAQ